MEKLRFLQLSDTHIGRGDNDDHLKTIVKGIIDTKNKHKCDTVVFTGDITDDGHRWQLRRANSIIDRLRDAFNVIIVPGNHDYGRNGIHESTEAQKRFHSVLKLDDDYPTVQIIGGVAYIGLDSMEKEMKDTEAIGAQGEIGKKQLIELDAELTDLRDNKSVKKIVVALHHHPFYYRYVMVLRDAGELKEVLKSGSPSAPRVDALVFGHKHGTKRFKNKEDKYGIPLIFASPKSTSMKKTKEGKAVFTINLIDLEKKSRKAIEIPA